MKKYLRQLLIIIVFCGGLGLLVAGANWLFSRSAQASNFDPIMKLRDKASRLHYERFDYAGAIKNYDRIIEIEPFDGYAMYKRAECYRKIYFSRASAPETYSEEQIGEAAQNTIAAYEPVVEYPRFRAATNFHLACIHARQKNADVAISYLEEAIAEGFQAPEGTGNLTTSNQAAFYFESLESDPRYRRLKRISLNNWQRNFEDRLSNQPPGRSSNDLNPGRGGKSIQRKPSIGN